MSKNFDQSKNFDRHLAEDRRLVILSVLEGSAGYETNEYTLEAVLADMAHHVSSVRLRADLAWLAEAGLVTTSSAGGVTLAKLTGHGLDVARGKAVAPGVKRPRPE